MFQISLKKLIMFAGVLKINMTKLKEGSGVKTTTVKHLFGLDIDRLNKYKDLPEAIKSNLGHLVKKKSHYLFLFITNKTFILIP